MGWGTTFRSEVYLNRAVFRARGELDSAIEDLEKNIEDTRQELVMYAASSPKDILSKKVLSESDNIEEWTPQDIIGCLQSFIDETLTFMLEDSRNLQLLYLFRAHLEETGDDIMKYWPYKDESI